MFSVIGFACYEMRLTKSFIRISSNKLSCFTYFQDQSIQTARLCFDFVSSCASFKYYILLRANNSLSRFTYLGFADYAYLSKIRVEVGNSNVKFSISERKKNHNISVVCFSTLKINLQCNSL